MMEIFAKLPFERYDSDFFELDEIKPHVLALLPLSCPLNQSLGNKRPFIFLYS
jgi:hypothetical protein